MASTPRPPGAKPSPEAAESSRRRSLECLLVDDSAADLLTLKSHLERAGHRARATQDPRAVEGELRRRSYDVLFLDIVMPELDGYSVLRRVRAQQHDLPVFIVSSKSGDSDLNWASLQGASGYLIKPFSQGDVVRCLEGVATP